VKLTRIRSLPEVTAAHGQVGRRPTAGHSHRSQVVEGRPPSTVDVPADDGSTCRYCLKEWMQGGPSAVYTFLYRV